MRAWYRFSVALNRFRRALAERAGLADRAVGEDGVLVGGARTGVDAARVGRVLRIVVGPGLVGPAGGAIGLLALAHPLDARLEIAADEPIGDRLVQAGSGLTHLFGAWVAVVGAVATPH